MLQQTQVEAAIPYYTRWMRRLPTLAHLKKAPTSRLLELWAGLGYYRRVHHLQAAARLIQTRHRGKFPQDHSQLLELPGIGRYTAGAICSIAFNQPTPILDGNVMRVLTRVFALSGDPRCGPLNARLWRLSQALVQTATSRRPARPRACGQLNQALMELGALICTPQSPRCPDCPLRAHCLAARSGRPTAFPTPRTRPATVIRRFAVFLVRHNSQILVRRQRASEWNVGLWGFPSIEMVDDQARPADLIRRYLGMRVGTCRLLGRIRHSITRYRLLLDVHEVEIPRRPRSLREGELWRRPAALRRLPFAAAHRKVVRLEMAP